MMKVEKVPQDAGNENPLYEKQYKGARQPKYYSPPLGSILKANDLSNYNKSLHNKSFVSLKDRASHAWRRAKINANEGINAGVMMGKHIAFGTVLISLCTSVIDGMLLKNLKLLTLSATVVIAACLAFKEEREKKEQRNMPILSAAAVSAFAATAFFAYHTFETVFFRDKTHIINIAFQITGIATVAATTGAVITSVLSGIFTRRNYEH